MKIVKSERVTPFDVDCCLIYPNAEGNEDMPGVMIYDAVDQKYLHLKYNPNMVRLLREEHERGSYIIVWSRSGWKWAKNAVIALGLETYVDRVMSKPIVYFDDTEIQDWLKDRVYIAPSTVYKR